MPKIASKSERSLLNKGIKYKWKVLPMNPVLTKRDLNSPVSWAFLISSKMIAFSTYSFKVSLSLRILEIDLFSKRWC